MKKELSIFEQMGGTYIEVDGIFYPNLVVKPEKNVMVGKYGTIWMCFMEVLDTMVQAYLKKHKPKNPDSTMEMWRLREQARVIAEEFILEDIVCRFH